MDQFNQSWEPMDVDVSHSSAMDVSYTETKTNETYINSPTLIEENIIKHTEFTETFTVKKFHIIRQNERRDKWNYNIIIPLVILTSISWVTYQINNFRCSEELNLHHVKNLLRSKVYGQENAIEDIIQMLKTREKSKILFLYGGTGVGKTYTTSLMLEDVWNFSNVYHYTMPSFAESFSSELMLGVIMCKTAVLVVDDLKQNDMHIYKHVQNVLERTQNLGKNIMIILIYNCDNVTKNLDKKCDVSFYQELSDNFRDIEVDKYFVKFEPLREEHLRKCIETELRDSNVNFDINVILKKFNVTLDGCKGVYSKMKIWNMI